MGYEEEEGVSVQVAEFPNNTNNSLHTTKKPSYAP